MAALAYDAIGVIASSANAAASAHEFEVRTEQLGWSAAEATFRGICNPGSNRSCAQPIESKMVKPSWHLRFSGVSAGTKVDGGWVSTKARAGELV